MGSLQRSVGPAWTWLSYYQTTMTWERFPNAPIAEALVDVRVTFSPPVDRGRLESLHDAIRDRYPIKQDRVQWRGQVLLGPEVVQQAVGRGPEGLMFKSPDERRIVQVRQDGYTFNWLKPYESWEALRAEARDRWEHYRDSLRPQIVTRLGLRYINRLEIPLPFDDFREYIKTAPDIAGRLPQGLSGLFMRLEIPHPTHDFVAIITEVMQPPIEGRRLPLLFDIDIVGETTHEPSDPAIWETLEKMREYKNEIFFESMTPKAKGLFR